MPSDDIESIWGNRSGLKAVWYQVALAQRLHAKVIPVNDDHLFPALLPKDTAVVLVESTKIV